MKVDNSVLEIFWKGLAVSIIVGVVIISLTYLIVDYPSKNPATVNVSFIKDVYSAIFTIFAPYIAIYLFNDWKQQKQYELEKEIFDKILDNIALSYYEITQTNTRMIRIESLISENLVIFSNRNEVIIKKNMNRFFLIYAELDKYEAMNSNQDLLFLFREYENSFLLLNRLNQNLINIYDSYYEKIDQNTIEKSPSNFSSRQYFDKYEKIHYRDEIKNFSDIINTKVKTNFWGDRKGIKNIESNISYKEADFKLRESYDNFIKIIIKKNKAKINTIH